ncbi:hypothetical protein HMN09_00662300 [Mycena chlorophos]|uniref:Uncharacterized protein n=1 Tax=Mycena chlorophos TaxID=658473 RepID=A0A8H6W9K2_MYCCL|nr:hypothetical protein HMN09_00662300 [Mycena chlorophos]
MSTGNPRLNRLAASLYARRVPPTARMLAALRESEKTTFSSPSSPSRSLGASRCVLALLRLRVRSSRSAAAAQACNTTTSAGSDGQISIGLKHHPPPQRRLLQRRTMRKAVVVGVASLLWCGWIGCDVGANAKATTALRAHTPSEPSSTTRTESLHHHKRRNLLLDVPPSQTRSMRRRRKPIAGMAPSDQWRGTQSVAGVDAKGRRLYLRARVFRTLDHSAAIHFAISSQLSLSYHKRSCCYASRRLASVPDCLSESAPRDKGSVVVASLRRPIPHSPLAHSAATPAAPVDCRFLDRPTISFWVLRRASRAQAPGKNPRMAGRCLLSPDRLRRVVARPELMELWGTSRFMGGGLAQLQLSSLWRRLWAD